MEFGGDPTTYTELTTVPSSSMFPHLMHNEIPVQASIMTNDIDNTSLDNTITLPASIHTQSQIDEMDCGGRSPSCTELATVASSSNISHLLLNEVPPTNQSSALSPPSSKRNKRERDPKKLLEQQQQKHPLLPPCNCKLKCLDKINEDFRKDIWALFWSMDRQRRRDFISRHVTKIDTKVKTVKNSRRHNTLIWKLNDTVTCKKFFLATIGYTNDENVQSVLKANFATSNKNPSVMAAPDLRGRHTPKHAFPDGYEESLVTFIEKYRPLQSHYNLKHAPHRRYLPATITFTKIYEDFLKYCLDNNVRKCSWTYFINECKKMNLSTAEPSQDSCDVCNKHKSSHPDINLSIHDCNDCGCDVCNYFPEHINNKNKSRQHLKEIGDLCANTTDNVLFTADMQKVICMPVLTTKAYYFSRKLVLFNETFAQPGQNKLAVCVLWHEGECGRKAFNIASAYVNFLLKFCRDLKHVYFFVDNCNAQNKNKIFFSALVRLVNDNSNSIEEVIIEYFEPGHTYMAADQVHASITNKINRTGQVYDFQDYVQQIQTSRKNVDTLVVTHEDMFLFENESKIKYPNGMNIQKFKMVKFKRGFLSLFAKLNYDDGGYTEIKFLKKKSEDSMKISLNKNKSLLSEIKRQENPRGICEVKKRDLLNLCQYMPQSRRQFFEELVVSDVADLHSEQDVDF
jgi:hypothetical protein